ncbi:dihydroxyacetone kinase-like protein [Pararhizobium capsulatum DSM 1112]|uniref:Dihydroxyacetone kinase-like protein n=1 Tax=Pararhizobium capsulatum DSM 1112 TaxID=1121113 RepID=A0ABU0C0T6_9HYPH|nr:dihydroxyacetone kinase subunit DhaL [Pararhizobium capsulatum]MDQ0324134.1 dihydroxyacetone kinase-like protein [Pararhizobium capsulatum DSM 1112]
MVQSLDRQASIDMLSHVAAEVIRNTDVLTNADLAIGDGDHGIGMQRGFEAVLESFQTTRPETIELAFKAAGMAVMAKTGGAAGAIFGTLFRSGSKAFVDQDGIVGSNFAGFLESGLEAVLKRGGATEGQKTIIDALAPAARAARAEAGKDKDLGQTVAAATKAALAGVEATKNMIATTGKARSLGERSLGHPDPGAISVAIILKAMQAFTDKA